jgi:hypothetical protein
MSLLVATWTGALATVGLLIGAGITAWYAKKAFREQSREVALLQEQVKNEQRDRAREAADRRRAQAAKVFIWVTESTDQSEPVIHVRNTSEQPIHELIISWAGDAVPMPVVTSEGGPLMPGEENVFDVADLAHADSAVWLGFRDAAGLRWRTTSRNELTELPDPQQASP